MQRKALFVAARYKSLGETYSLARFGEALRDRGWRVEFLAFDYAARFLRQHGLPATLLVENTEANRDVFARTALALRPDLIVTADYFLLSIGDMPAVWSNEWLFEPGCAVATFDHLMFHPRAKTLRFPFHKRLRILAQQAQTVPNAGRSSGSAARLPRRGSPTHHEIPPLPEEIIALIRSCPIHDPRPEPDPRIFRFSGAARERQDACSRAGSRIEFGISQNERLVVMPIGSWSVQLCRDFQIPHYEYMPTLLVRYLEAVPAPVRLIFVSSEFRPHVETHGQVTVTCQPAVPFPVLTRLMRAADLVLTDNVTSASLGRAVMAGVPAAAAVSSVSVGGGDRAPTFDAPFPLSPFVRNILAELERRAPGSVFPFALFPMGLREEMEPMFVGNLYTSTFQWLELFDEKGMTEAFRRLLCDEVHIADLMARQAAYRSAVLELPDADETAEAILLRAAATRVRT